MQNFGIICAFGVGFISMYLIFTQLNTRSAGEATVTLFKHGTRETDAETRNTSDVEAGEKDTSVATDFKGQEKDAEKDAAKELVAAAPAMTDIFSWQHLEYTVPLSDGSQRRLLDDISGFVAPGKLTALMGESGAGKVSA